jgi:hypothetical protein
MKKLLLGITLLSSLTVYAVDHLPREVEYNKVIETTITKDTIHFGIEKPSDEYLGMTRGYTWQSISNNHYNKWHHFIFDYGEAAREAQDKHDADIALVEGSLSSPDFEILEISTSKGHLDTCAAMRTVVDRSKEHLVRSEEDIPKYIGIPKVIATCKSTIYYLKNK